MSASTSHPCSRSVTALHRLLPRSGSAPVPCRTFRCESWARVPPRCTTSKNSSTAVASAASRLRIWLAYIPSRLPTTRASSASSSTPANRPDRYLEPAGESDGAGVQCFFEQPDLLCAFIDTLGHRRDARCGAQRRMPHEPAPCSARYRRRARRRSAHRSHARSPDRSNPGTSIVARGCHVGIVQWSVGDPAVTDHFGGHALMDGAQRVPGCPAPTSRCDCADR